MNKAADTFDPLPHGQRILLAIGSGGLLVAMAADAIAVLGRHIGFTFPGSIEIFQVAIVVGLSASILLASLADRHAAVDLIVTRASAGVRHRLVLVGRLALALTFALLFAGSAWVAADLWSTHEMTELLAIPLRPFRLVWIVACGLAALYFARAFVTEWRR